MSPLVACTSDFRRVGQIGGCGSKPMRCDIILCSLSWFVSEAETSVRIVPKFAAGASNAPVPPSISRIHINCSDIRRLSDT
jgi:hypothetical protein